MSCGCATVPVGHAAVIVHCATARQAESQPVMRQDTLFPPLPSMSSRAARARIPGTDGISAARMPHRLMAFFKPTPARLSPEAA